jgi:hypothetical protein
MKTKTIFFILDSFNLYDFKKLYNNLEYICCYSYFDTEEAIDNKIDNIITYDIGHLSFDLEDLGYQIFIGYNGKYKHFTDGMSTANGKELRKAHNLRRLLIGGALDNDLGIENPKFYYDSSKSTNELMEDEQSKQQLSLVQRVLEKTFMWNMGPGVKAMSDEESYEWHKKHSRVDPKTGNLIISNDEIGDGTYEKNYCEN